MMTLKDVECGQKVTVVKLHGKGVVKKKNYGYGDN